MLEAQGAAHGSAHLFSGQETGLVGAWRTLEERDALTVTYPGNGSAIERGIRVAHLFTKLRVPGAPVLQRSIIPRAETFVAAVERAAAS